MGVPGSVGHGNDIERTASSLTSEIQNKQDVYALPNYRNNTAVNVLVQCMMSCRKLDVSRINASEFVQFSRQDTVNEYCSRFWTEFENWSTTTNHPDHNSAPCCRKLFQAAFRTFDPNDVDFVEEL